MVIALMIWLGVAAADDAQLYHEPTLTWSADLPLDVVVDTEDIAAMGQVELFYRRIGDTQ